MNYPCVLFDTLPHHCPRNVCECASRGLENARTEEEDEHQHYCHHHILPFRPLHHPIMSPPPSPPTPRTALAEEETLARSSSSLRPAHSALYTTSMTYASAGLANVISACFTNPADVIKVRQQLLKDRARASFLSVATGMIRSEGVVSLWSGVTAACLREGTYSTIRMGGYEPLKRIYDSRLGLSESSFANKLLAGITSGAIGAACSSPTDLMKIRMQAARPDGRPPYKTSFHGFVQVYKEGGLRALWRGVYPNTIRAAVLTSSQIATYDQVKGWFKKSVGLQEGLGLHFAASMVAG